MTSARKVSCGTPQHLSAKHDLAEFDSGVPELDDWLRRQALSNESAGATRTYVTCIGRRVVGYYSLATGAVEREHATGRVRRNMPKPIPVMILARLAVDHRYQHQGIGRGLVKDAVLRTLQAADIAGLRAMLVHATSDDAKRFYESLGFSASPVDPMTVMMTIADAKKIVEG